MPHPLHLKMTVVEADIVLFPLGAQPDLDQPSVGRLDCRGPKCRRLTMRSFASVATKQAAATITEIQNTNPVYQRNASCIGASVLRGARTAVTERPATADCAQAESTALDGDCQWLDP